MKLAVFLPNWIGDVVMATPALRALREHFSGAELVGILRPYVSDVLAGSALLDRVLIHDPKGPTSTHRGISFLAALRHERFDLAVILPNSLRAGFWGWASGAKQTIGYARNGRSFLLTNPIPASSQATPHPVLDEMLQLVAQLGCRSLSRRMELATTPSEEQQLFSFWQKHPSYDSSNYVVLNTGGAFGAAKDWPTEHFVELARKIVTELDATVLIVCGPSERSTASQIVSEVAHPRAVSLASEVSSIGLTKAAIRHASLLVTTDSGPRHFAAAFDVPTITLFGPTHIAWSETFHSQSVHLQLPIACGPCQQRTCPLKHHRCMRDLSVEQVFAEVTRRWPNNSRRLGKAA